MDHEFLATAPFDLQDLHVFHLLAETGHFTQAARRAGLTQSSLTRRIQSMEEKLGVALFERTTRRVGLTSAGRFLQSASGRLVGDISATLKQLGEQFAGVRPEVRVGVSRSISLAHLPGLFAASLRHQPEVVMRVLHGDSIKILEDVEKSALDLAVLCPPSRLPASLTITHRFKDSFEVIAPRDLPLPAVGRGGRRFGEWMGRQRWLLLSPDTQTAPRMKRWFSSQGLKVQPFMELDSFDMIVHLVALGMGVGMVPQRALAPFARKRALQRIPWKPRFSRELVVVARKQKTLPPHLEQFVGSVLF